MNRQKRRDLTQKVINKRLEQIKRLPQKDCLVIQTLINEPHRLAKDMDCNEDCVDTSCPFYSN